MLSMNAIIAFEFGLGLLAVVLGWIFAFDPLQTIARGPAALLGNLRQMALGAALAVPLLAFFLALERFVQSWQSQIREVLFEHLIPLMDEVGWAGRAVVSLGAGVGEELLFRGLIQHGAHQAWGAVPALLLASVLFGAAHYVNRVYFVAATFMGVVFGLLLIWTGSLLTPITTHAVYDFLALEQLVRQFRAPA